MRSLVHDHEMRQAILARTHHDVIRQWQRLVPESDTPLWMGGTEEQLRKRLTELRPPTSRASPNCRSTCA